MVKYFSLSFISILLLLHTITTLQIDNRGRRQADSVAFRQILQQKTNGNQQRQCPCVIHPSSGQCIVYDSHFLAANLEEAMLAFLDMTGAVTDVPVINGRTFQCTTPQCQQCFSILYYRFRDVGLIQNRLDTVTRVLSEAQIDPSQCSRLNYINPPRPVSQPPPIPPFLATLIAAGGRILDQKGIPRVPPTKNNQNRNGPGSSQSENSRMNNGGARGNQGRMASRPQLQNVQLNQRQQFRPQVQQQQQQQIQIQQQPQQFAQNRIQQNGQQFNQPQFPPDGPPFNQQLARLGTVAAAATVASQTYRPKSDYYISPPFFAPRGPGRWGNSPRPRPPWIHPGSNFRPNQPPPPIQNPNWGPNPGPPWGHHGGQWGGPPPQPGWGQQGGWGPPQPEPMASFGGFPRHKREEMRTKRAVHEFGTRFDIHCYQKGEAPDEDGMISLCGTCWSIRRLPDDYFPHFINERSCNTDDYCLSGWGTCVPSYRPVEVVRNVNGRFVPTTVNTVQCCDCRVQPGTNIHSLVTGP